MDQDFFLVFFHFDDLCIIPKYKKCVKKALYLENGENYAVTITGLKKDFKLGWKEYLVVFN